MCPPGRGQINSRLETPFLTWDDMLRNRADRCVRTYESKQRRQFGTGLVTEDEDAGHPTLGRIDEPPGCPALPARRPWPVGQTDPKQRVHAFP